MVVENPAPTIPTDKAVPPVPPVPAEGAAKPAEETPKPQTPSQEEGVKSLMDEVGAEEKTEVQKEEERLLNAKDEELNDADKAKKSELVKAKAETERLNSVPEKYEFKMPEGMAVDQVLVDKISPILKEGKVSLGVAQKLADAYAEHAKAMATNFETQQKEAFSTFVQGLKKETIDALGPNYKEELSLAAKARDRLMPPGLIEKLNISGLSNDVDLVKFLISLGKTISEGKVVEGKPGALGDDKNPIGILYDADKKKG